MTVPPSGPWPPPQGPPQYWGPPHPPSKDGGKAKWILGGLSILVVVAVTVVVTLLVTRAGSDHASPAGSTPTSDTTSHYASASDDGPVSVIVDEPTCHDWTNTAAGLAHAGTGGWNQRDVAVPSTEWSSDQRKQYDAFAAAVRVATNSAGRLARDTPHRVIRVLYEQFIAYGNAYANSIPEYKSTDDQLYRVANSFTATLNAVCDAISFGSASARAPLVPSVAAPRGLSTKSLSESPQEFLRSPHPLCNDWLKSALQFSGDTSAWRTVDPNIPATDLTPEQQVINNAVIPVMESYATTTQSLGRESDNVVWADIASLSAQYRRAYVSALPTYAPADNALQLAAGSAVGATSEACRAAGN